MTDAETRPEPERHDKSVVPSESELTQQTEHPTQHVPTAEAGGTHTAYNARKGDRRHDAANENPPPQHVLALGLLYPAALGAALAWYIQAAVQFYTKIMDGSVAERGAASWALLTALWFLVYHGVWYVARNAARPSGSDWPSEAELGYYGARRFASDVLDIVGLFGAFLALGVVTGTYQQPFVARTYMAVLAVAVAAAMLRGSMLAGLAMVMALIGLLNRSGTSVAPDVGDVLVLSILWLLLIVYIASRLGGAKHPLIRSLIKTRLWGASVKLDQPRTP